MNMDTNKVTNDDEMVPVDVDVPQMTRVFPREIEFVLPLRQSFRSYKEAGGRVLVQDVSPETDANESSSGEMYTMSIQVPIVGHGTVMNEKLVVCENKYGDVPPSMMGYAISSTAPGALKWVIGDNPSIVKPIPPKSTLMNVAASQYAKWGPLCVYTNLAVIEAANHSSDNHFWRNLYKPLELLDCHYGIYGLFYDNTALSMGIMSGDDDNASIEGRKPSPYHRGFIGVSYTPQSKGAGRVRTLVFGCTIRVTTPRTIELASEIMSVLKCGFGVGLGDWILRCMGFCCVVTLEEVHAMLDVWKLMCEPNMPTMHVFEAPRVVTISVSSGVLIRPIRTFVQGDRFRFEGPFVDTMTVYHSDTLKFINATFPGARYEPEQFLEIAALSVPFSMWTTEPRIALATQMLMQSMNKNPISGDATLVSMGESEPLVSSAYMDVIRNSFTDKSNISIPGRNVVAAFINCETNNEDACVLTKEWAESGSAAWYGFINYPLPKDCGVVESGTLLKNQPWWKPSIEGVVMSTSTSKSGDPYAIVLIGSKKAKIGDKFATNHGLKFTVGELVPAVDMPLLKDTVTGEKFRPTILISTKNITRGIGGQVREMSAATSRFGSISEFRTLQKPKGESTFGITEQRKIEPTLPTAYVTMEGKKIEFMDEKVGMRTVRCSYGIMRLLQLRHLSVLKQHYPSTVVRSIKVPRGKFRLGTPRLGETELLSMMMQKMRTRSTATARSRSR
ncbi:hypothetical protein B0J12DRAFT_747803 [Macrophomina phaseolina]|uniref:DNA-directed RNA polymerase n=1 Tax=Macrophomina phaseolina TaxID=35725 RepID=A0ABQ8FPB5_9PEZI|nr:hypothetical protein B0J12DRAFT_747803 [Macrophomina phaseolina]